MHRKTEITILLFAKVVIGNSFCFGFNITVLLMQLQVCL